MRVGFTFNIKRKTGFDETEIEWDTPETIGAISRALSRNAEVVPIEADRNVYQKLRTEKPDIVFNYAEGAHGEERESEIPAMLESLGLPYTGSDPAAMTRCLNKARTKEILKGNSVTTADFTTIHAPEEIEPAEYSFPCIVKPAWEGSSKGIHNNAIVSNQGELRSTVETILNEYGQPALVETFLPGREFTIGVLGNGADARILPIVEFDYSVLPGGLEPILSYEAKWVVDDPSNPLKILICPAETGESLRAELETISLDTFHVLGCRDWSRIDIRLDEKGKPNILEVNPLPGLLPDPNENSCLPTAARATGLDFEDLVNEVLEVALKRYGMSVEEQRSCKPSTQCA